MLIVISFFAAFSLVFYTVLAFLCGTCVSSKSDVAIYLGIFTPLLLFSVTFLKFILGLVV